MAMSEAERPCAAVAYVKRDDGKLLVVWNKRYGRWSMPGGKVEAGERKDAAVVRELHEETGLAATRVTFIYEGDHGESVESSPARSCGSKKSDSSHCGPRVNLTPPPQCRQRSSGNGIRSHGVCATARAGRPSASSSARAQRSLEVTCARRRARMRIDDEVENERDAAKELLAEAEVRLDQHIGMCACPGMPCVTACPSIRARERGTAETEGERR